MRATYGTSSNNIDVTDKVRSMVNGNSLRITASNDLAGDPARGVVKTLTIAYTYNESLSEVRIRERQTVTIP